MGSGRIMSRKSLPCRVLSSVLFHLIDKLVSWPGMYVRVT